MKAKPSSTLCTRWWPPFLAPSIFSSSHHVLLLFNSFSPSLSGKEGKKEMKTIGCFLCVCVCPAATGRDNLARIQQPWTTGNPKELHPTVWKRNKWRPCLVFSQLFLSHFAPVSFCVFFGFLNSYINVCVCTTERELKKPKRNKCRETCNTFFLLRGCGIQKRKFGAGLSPIRDVFSLRLQCRAAHYCRAHTAGGKGRKLVWATR